MREDREAEAIILVLLYDTGTRFESGRWILFNARIRLLSKSMLACVHMKKTSIILFQSN